MLLILLIFCLVLHFCFVLFVFVLYLVSMLPVCQNFPFLIALRFSRTFIWYSAYQTDHALLCLRYTIYLAEQQVLIYQIFVFFIWFWFYLNILFICMSYTCIQLLYRWRYTLLFLTLVNKMKEKKNTTLSEQSQNLKGSEKNLSNLHSMKHAHVQFLHI